MRDERGEERGVRILLDVDARGAQADLALVGEGGGGGEGGEVGEGGGVVGRGDEGVGEEEERVFAAEFEGEVFPCFPGG